MSQEQDNIAKDFEGILRKTLEINSQYLKQGTKLIGELNNSRSQKKTINPLQPDLIVGAFTAFTKLNLDHYKNMVDLGFEFSKKIINTENGSGVDPEEATGKNVADPAFVLEETVSVKSNVSLQFVLDNTRKEKATCTIENSAFVERNMGNTHNFKTTFVPQSFTLDPGASQIIKIAIKIGARVQEGTYQSTVKIIGFEPAHFLIKLHVVKKITKAVKDGH